MWLIACGIAAVGGEVARVHEFGLWSLASQGPYFTSHRTLLLGIGLAAGVLSSSLGHPAVPQEGPAEPIYGLPAALRFESNTKWYKANRTWARR